MAPNDKQRGPKMVHIEALASEALSPARTDQLFVEHQGLFPELCARWLYSDGRIEDKVAAFGRILPLAPHLAEHVERFLQAVPALPILGPQGSSTDTALSGAHEANISSLLLGTFRLLSYDCSSFAQHVRPIALESLFTHSSRVVRYLAIRTFCLYVHAADHATQEMLKRWLGDGDIDGPWEHYQIDYRFLSLWEEKRWKELHTSVQHPNSDDAHSTMVIQSHQLSPYTVDMSGVLLPRLDGAPKYEDPTKLVITSTTASNLRKVAHGLREAGPILLTGLAGSGKSLFARHFAWQLNKLETMVTLHLNEQSDAKLLIGMYATGAKPGTFTWRPGVLTTAVREGRWIFIEDLDRAPNEVVSTLLPLIERGELLIPSRGETVRAARGFRIIATMRSMQNTRGQEIVPRQNMIGHRFWNSITVSMPGLSEFEHIIHSKYPSLRKHLSGIMRVYSRLLDLFSDPKFSSDNGTSIRAVTPRDLLKWCGRINVLLAATQNFGSAQADDIFLEASDCFAGSLRSNTARSRVMACVAEELHIDPQKRDHLLSNRVVRLQVPAKTAASGTIQIGRAKLSKHKVAKRERPGRPFSTNNYTLRLLEKIAVAVDRREPLLLVGETGTGKTTCIQYLAEQLGRKLVAFNLSQQSESGDLLGGYKPVNVRSLIIPLKDEFDELFETTFSRKKNLRFIDMLGKRVAKGEWRRVCTLWREALKMVDAARKAHESQTSSPDPDGEQPKKKRRMDSLPATFPAARWDKFATDLYDLEAQLSNGSDAFAFSFLEGNIVKAVRNGDWVLLDEINLASSDTLEALTDLLGGGPDGNPSILLTETGNVERIVAHPNFRVFAAMNPATDVGKKDLPPGVRSRFTELYVESPDADETSLRNIVEQYLDSDGTDPAISRIARDVTKLYLAIQGLAKSNMLVDGADQKAHFSLRTLTRTLSYAREIAPLCNLRRALYEGFHMSFLTFLGKASEDLVAPLIIEHLFPQKTHLKAELGKPLQQPSDGRSYIRQGQYWLRQGLHPVQEQSHYIITPFVQRNMNNLIRAASTRRYPVLIQGPTSSGKTSMVEYLAKRSGNKFVRINNHEHTDLQEYLGSYISGTDGKLTFQEGILVKALREGHWIVLDELNLAPTDVLEALNRLLDDNRELLIPETQEIIRPHDDFMLFATQNPAGLYGGRKVMSRAFRNRFLELHFDDIPIGELTEILHRRTMIPESWCKRIVQVYQDLSTLRQQNRIFEQKSFATLRDLFRWAQRKADTIQELANNGYMLLAERVRKEEERIAVKRVMESVMSKNGPKVTIDVERMFDGDAWSGVARLTKGGGGSAAGSGIVWTRAMRRLFVLVAHALRNNEPVLLIGETGCGKTTVCQLLANEYKTQLHIVNAHQNTETGDLIGAQRPIRNRTAIEKTIRQQVLEVFNIVQNLDFDPTSLDLVPLLDLYDRLLNETPSLVPIILRQQIQANRIKAAALFEWADGSLVHAMKQGHYFLLDEISLADDSVLERLNSVLEPSRTLLLAEKGPTDSEITASDGFQFMATMNPGGDYGKKELSPALRNRFTEIWVPAMSDLDDILQIVQSKLTAAAVPFAGAIVSFSQWFNDKYNTSVTSSISIRDSLAWVSFINSCPGDDPIFALVHGAAMVFIDTLGANPAGLLAISQASVKEERRACLHHLSKLLGQDVLPDYFEDISITRTDGVFQMGSFATRTYSTKTPEASDFALDAPTTRLNAMRVVRALQLPKPILLEGNPGVGKTTLVTTLAAVIGKPLTRLNLSEQTDLMDLFGSDVPVEGGAAGNFAWRDAPFLKAMKNGDWVLLDEMNLASQSVLEGLNAVLDHRGEVYVSELDQTFHKHPGFRVFAAQNPHHQGGGRKGLPASFVNRFTVVYADILQTEDLTLICNKVFPTVEKDAIANLIKFVADLDEQVVTYRTFGQLGAPWEFNLRDTLRWLQLLASKPVAASARDFLDTIFVQRFRTESDRERLHNLFEATFGSHQARSTLFHGISTSSVQVGLGILPRDETVSGHHFTPNMRLSQLGPMEALVIGVKQSWPLILVGSSGAGKTTLIHQLAAFAGAELVTFAMNADIDAMDLVGGYEQVDPTRELHRCMEKLEDHIRRRVAAANRASQADIALLEELVRGKSATPMSLNKSLLEPIMYADAEVTPLVKDLLYHLQVSQEDIAGARFQWVDGILIRALVQGQWLVLDNANLCSSAVLDRLNSLLEPNGYISINEHATADGEARIVRPHPNFRIFMTMDARFGELSRAMRNRAVEICLLDSHHNGILPPSEVIEYPLDSKVYRFRQFRVQQEHLDLTLEACFSNLSFCDTDMLESFHKQAQQGLIFTNGASNGVTTQDIQHTLHAQGISEKLPYFTRFINNVWEPRVRAMYTATMSTLITGLKPYHPLGNELALQGTNDSASQALWCATMYDIMLDVYNMQYSLESLPLAKFERRKEKQKLPAFLQGYWQALVKMMDNLWTGNRGNQPLDRPFLRALITLFWAFMKLAEDSAFDRATFQTYLKMLASTVPVHTDLDHPLLLDLQVSLRKHIALFDSEVHLTTGLGMDRIWTSFKPETPKTLTQLETIAELEGLADRFDKMIWSSDLTLDEMMQLRERIASSLDLVRSHEAEAAELVTSFRAAICDLEHTYTEHSTWSTPYFEEEFEGLCQFLDVASKDDLIARPPNSNTSPTAVVARAKSSLLARRPTKLRAVVVGESHEPAIHFAKLYRYIGLTHQPAKSIALTGQFHVSMLSKLHDADEVPLARLGRFEAELQVLSQQVALDACCITEGQDNSCDSLYRSIYDGLFASHCVEVCASLHQGQVTFYDNAPVDAIYRSMLEEGFAKCYRPATADARAWIQLGLFGLNLYVPSYPHDPALRPMVVRKTFHQEQQAVQHALSALIQFQYDFTGQKTSARIRILEEKLRTMGEEPPVPAIVRPTISQLDDLQGEFSNLLNTIQPLNNGSMTVEESIQNQVLHHNISRIIQRLTEGYRAYDDITDTVVGFLVCLKFGLILGGKELEEREDSVTDRSLGHLSRMTPFFGRQSFIGNTERILHELERGLEVKDHIIDVRWHALQSLLVVKSTDPAGISSSAARMLLHGLFSSLYGDWKKRLLEDQEKQAKDSSLYTYKGMDEEEEDEDLTLFPDYDNQQPSGESTTPFKAASNSRDHAIRVADVHAALFVQDQDVTEVVKNLVQWCAFELNRVSGKKAHGTGYENALPAIYLLLEQKMNGLQTRGTGQAYNFYYDANMSEAKRLIKLIHLIQDRYREIRIVWPEHATLGEVLSICDETLDFRHVDPVAKLITKAEKLHAFMYEWQKVASKEFSAADLYDDLTKLLVSWRQLELTTWSRLFDLEMEKFRSDAKSWFFIAYETIIAASETIEDDASVALHAKNLLKSLESFFETTTLGQFEQRMELLKQLRTHTATCMQDFHAFEVIRNALDNFISYFSRLQKPVLEAISKGRQSLEKEVNNVIKLASWKDTNIEALKQSAKTSHKKLSKWVRKFRKLLNRPISSIWNAGFPNESHSLQYAEMQSITTSVDDEVVRICCNGIPGWDQLPARFKNVNVTINLMRSKTTPGIASVDGALYIDNLVTELDASSIELRKATPTLLTEENKDTVQHLKAQKRKLYADTMRELRQMGVNSNLSVDALSKQDETSTILSTIPALPDHDGSFGRAAEYYLHKAMNMMIQVRAVSKEHSGDLTPNDVAKSIGYLEGLLNLTIRQRIVLNRSLLQLKGIATPISKIKDLATSFSSPLRCVFQQQYDAFKDVQPNLRWLSAILKAGADMVSAQAKLGMTSVPNGLLHDMRQCATRFADLSNCYEKLPNLPRNIQSGAYQDLDDRVKSHLDEMDAIFNKWMAETDMARTILRHVQPFLFRYPEIKAMHSSEELRITIESHARDLLASMDLILGSMQDVETALKQVPTSTDDATWLVAEGRALSTSFDALHTPMIHDMLQKLVNETHCLQDEASLKTSAALYASIVPILDQYVASHEYILTRFDSLHASTSKLLHHLCNSFVQIGTQGFCQPSEKSADQQNGQNEKLEEGTGLGAGEGAEDISKDIEEDEDLEDLAQEKGEREGSIEENDDAVDMGEQEMEGETEDVGEKEDKGDESGEEDDDDVQSEVGSVDDLGPSAVDEKLWDEGGKADDAKDKEGKEDVGTENQDEQIAAEQNEKDKQEGGEDVDDKEEEGEQEEDDVDMEGEEQDEKVGTGEAEKLDPHAKEEETLDLPEDLNMDGQDDEGNDDDGLGEIDMGDDLAEEDAEENDANASPDVMSDVLEPEHEDDKDEETTGHAEEEEQSSEAQEEEGEEPVDDQLVPLPDENVPDNDDRDAKDTDHADPDADTGAGNDANEEAHRSKHEQASANAANQDDGQEGESSEQKQETTAEEGTLGQTSAPDASGRSEQTEESRETQSFKKLGDVLEKWYNQQKQISEARDKDEMQAQQLDKEVDMADADFEHLLDDNMEADTQALGTATEEQATALDHDMALPVKDDEEKIPARPEDEDDSVLDTVNDVNMADAELEEERTQDEEQQQPKSAEGKPQNFIGEQKLMAEDEDAHMDDARPVEDDNSDASSTHEVEVQLEVTHLDNTPITPDVARALWLAHESATHSLSQQLTEHLRLILAPTLATKLRGDFRTGKRLNLKRIIPYIASGYKRDKIWLRRSQPSKRSYQVMIALDDSKSMAESGASNLALKTLTLVAKSLAMLEVGEVSVVGFGDQVNVAHEFDRPFTSEAGVRVFEQFSFDAAKTNVRGLVDKSLELFSDARQKGSTSVGEDLWQLMLIVSDGICDSHAEIQRLIRKAQEERVMIVFIIIDSSASAPAGAPTLAQSDQSTWQPTVPLAKAQDKTSILDLQSVEITPEGKVVRWKYMERFPFRYYLVVRDVRELPGVLAGALRQWFGEVAGTA
ncbi:hypothetical protein FB567DRAFT_535490 [Paraphoma chrysanthemicola]|uniref:Midasin n=1 Tax=Paraphoma chrysanthemicola TaxID=798071 RepID=A0A8K0QYF2_9PLEO|nr:hypothetical protein FB567DRAFT_535490 [Paraphoma chrysanthemicola]